MTGEAFREKLFAEYNIDTELADGDAVLAILTTANDDKDYEALTRALVSLGREWAKTAPPLHAVPPRGPAFPKTCPEMAMSPREAWFAPKKTVSWSRAAGCVAGEALIPYPPGIPLIYPGERITSEVWSYMEEIRRKGLHFHGPADLKLDTLRIIEE